MLTNLLNREIEVLHLGSEIQSKVNSALSKSQREYFLREQLKAIQKELGESGEQGLEIKELRDKIDKAQMPPDVKKVAIKEVDRLAAITPAAAEYAVSRAPTSIGSLPCRGVGPPMTNSISSRPNASSTRIITTSNRSRNAFSNI